MAYDRGLAALMRDDLGARAGLGEKPMFGGLCFLLDGNMLCGISPRGAIYRVGKANEAAALAIAGAAPMAFTGRRMGGMIDADETLMADDARRRKILGLALEFVAALPAK